MRVFVTGASGHVGSALVPELLAAGHQVVGLARSDASAERLRTAGAEATRGDLADLDGLRAAAAAADGVIHLAYRHDLMATGDAAGASDADLVATRALAAALEGSGKPLVTTSGTMMFAAAGGTGQHSSGRPGTERDTAPDGPRVEAENLVVGLAEHGVRSSVVRLPPIVHSELDQHGFAHILVAAAREAGASAYVGEGSNQWPAVHTLDAARLYRLALESAPAGSRLHAVADEGVPFRDIAAAIGRGLGVPVRSITAEEASASYAFLGRAMGVHNAASSEATRGLLGWRPEHPTLLADLAGSHYFRER